MSLSTLPFVKVEGLGNDFILLDLRRDPDSHQLERLARVAPRWCDRRRGVGADGLLVILPATDEVASARMVVLNADGSRPEMCGNGLRCVAAFVADAWSRTEPSRRPHEELVAIVETDAGPHRCRIAAALAHREDVAEVDVDVEMVPAILGETVEVPEAPGRHFVTVSMGNPHAVAFVTAEEDPEALARQLGPGVEQAAAFPDRTNVEFVRAEGDRRLTTWVWERGCGIEACGTGACAVAAAAVARGLATRDVPVTVTARRGALHRAGEASAGVRMRGPAGVCSRGA